MRNFCGTESEIWAGFGLDGIAEIKNWATYEQLLRAFFHGLMGKKIILKIVVHLGTKNLYQMKGRKTDLLLKNLIMNLK